MNSFKRLSNSLELYTPLLMKKEADIRQILISDDKYATAQLINRLRVMQIYTIYDLLAFDKTAFFQSTWLTPRYCKNLCRIIKHVFKELFEQQTHRGGSAVYLLESFEILSSAPREFLDKKIAYVFSINTRLENALSRNGIYTYSDLLELGIKDFMLIENLGEKSYKSISIIINEDYKTFGTHEIEEIGVPNKTLIDVFLEDYKEASKSYDAYKTYNRHYYDVIINRLSTLVKEYVCDRFSFDKSDIFSRRLANETLESIAQSYGLTRERIRRITKNIEKSVARIFSTNSAFYTHKSINEYYQLILSLNKDELLGLISAIIASKDVNSNILLSLLQKNNLELYLLQPNDIKVSHHKKHSTLLKQEMELQDYVNNIRNTLFTKEEKLLFLSLLECTKIYSKVTSKILLDYMNGSSKSVAKTQYYGCCHRITIETLKKIINKYASLKLIKRHKLRYMTLYYVPNMELVTKANFITRISGKTK